MSLTFHPLLIWQRRAIFGLIVLLLALAPWVSADVDAPARLKAAYLYNFAKLTYWPGLESSADEEGQLIICTLAAEDLTQNLKVITSQPVQGRPVRVVELSLKSRADFCYMIFVDDDHTKTWFRSNTGPQKGQLVVGESSDFVDRGGAIRFFLEGNKLRFEISLENAGLAGVQISSRLLKLARLTGGES